MSGAWRRLAGRYGMAPSRMVFTADLGTGWRRLLGVSFPVVTAILLQLFAVRYESAALRLARLKTSRGRCKEANREQECQKAAEMNCAGDSESRWRTQQDIANMRYA